MSKTGGGEGEGGQGHSPIIKVGSQWTRENLLSSICDKRTQIGHNTLQGISQNLQCRVVLSNWSLRTSILCIVGNLAEGGFVAVAVGVIDMGHMIRDA